MSCAYRHATTRIATIAGIPPDLMLTAMDIARQRRVTFPALPPDRLRTIAPLLGIAPTCGNPQQVIARAQSALIALGTLHPSQAWVERGMAIAAALGVPEDHLPVPVHPEIMATVRAQWAAPPPDPAPDRATAGIAALWRGNPIPAELIDEAIRASDRTAIVTWMAHGGWDDRFTDVCRNLTNAEIGTIVRAGVITDALVERIAQRWQSDNLPWDVFPLAMWDRVPDPKIAREGRARTAAARLIRDPALRDNRLIDAAAQHPRWAAAILGKRYDRCDDCLIAAVAQDPWYARDVLIARHDLRDHRLIAAAAKDPLRAQDVLLARPDLRTETCLITAAADPDWWAYDILIKHSDRYTDEQLIAIAAQEPSRARDVLLARPDVSDERLIAAVADATDRPWLAQDVLTNRPDLSDPRLIAAVARNAVCAHDVLVTRHDLSDDCLIEAVAGNAAYAHNVLVTRHDLSDDRLIAAVADATDRPHLAQEVLTERRDLSDPRLIATVARSAVCARDVLRTRDDLRTNEHLLTAIASQRELVDDVLTQYPDLRDHPILNPDLRDHPILTARTDVSGELLIAAVARDAACARDILVALTDLSDPRLIAAVARDAACARDVLIARPDLRTNTRLLTAIARDRALVDSVLAQVPELRDHPILAAVRHADGSSG